MHNVTIAGVTFSPGNSKLGTDVPSVSLMPGCSCHPDVPCHKQCYAKHIADRFRLVREQWIANTAVAAADPARFGKAAVQYCLTEKPKRFRIHVGGDFISSHYFMEWRYVAEQCPKTKFLVFTKRYDLMEDAARMDHDLFGSDPRCVRLPVNMRVVVSRWTGDKCRLRPDVWPMAYMHDPRHGTTVPPYARPCHGTCVGCEVCWNLQPGEAVYFPRH